MINDATEKRMFGGQFFRYSKVVMVSGFMYESRAILGRALSPKIAALEIVLGTPKEEDLINTLQQAATDRLNGFDKEPDSFGMFIIEG